MCGIFGVLYRDGRTLPDDGRVQRTAATLGHRGPDAAGEFKEPGVALVHARLSLLDLSERGNQPFWDEGRRYALVYNGEIYNFQAIRAEMQAKGLSFSTESDTEVLLKGILHFGLDALLPRLEGMFAFGLWDREERRLTLVRDRLGIKPLSVYVDEDVVLFSSEIKAMRHWRALEPDPHMASAYLAGFGGPTRDRSFFRGVSMLAPGTVLQVRPGESPVTRRFFRVADFWDPEENRRLASLAPRAAVDALDSLLFESVRKHLIADAPVGAFCSGGLDSSLVMAMASRLHSNLAIFHADVAGPLSEYDAAAALARHLRLDMKTVRVSDQDFVDQLAPVLWHYEYPFTYHPNSVPFLAVSRLVRASGVKAVLSGEGSDECFLGYGPIAYEDMRRGYRALLRRVRGAVHRVPKLGKALWPAPDLEPLVAGMQQNFERDLDRVEVEERVREAGGDFRPRDYRSLEWLGYHLRTLLHRNDALGMAASIEARFPYLDHDVIRFAVNLPYGLKIRPSLTTLERAHPFLRDKWVVRAVADRYVPRALSQRKKIGFPVNAYERLQCDRAFFRDGFVAGLYRLDERSMAHLLENAAPPLALRLLMLEAWGRLFFRDTPLADLSTDLQRRVAVRPR